MKNKIEQRDYFLIFIFMITTSLSFYTIDARIVISAIIFSVIIILIMWEGLYYITKIVLVVSLLVSIIIPFYVSNFIEREIVNVQNTTFNKFSYDVSGRNIYVNYDDKESLRVLNYHNDNFDYVYMKLNNCQPVLTETVKMYWFDNTSKHKEVICLEDFFINSRDNNAIIRITHEHY